MRIFFDNVGFVPAKGPNCFALKLLGALKKMGHGKADEVGSADAHLAFICQKTPNSKIPVIQRIDGIYYSTVMDNVKLNSTILESYNKVDEIIIQTNFDRDVITNTFGDRDNITVIHNGADLDLIETIVPLQKKEIDRFNNIYVSAARWKGRMNKRIGENIRCFMEHSNADDGMVILGNISDIERHIIKKAKIKNKNILSWGHIDWHESLALFKRAKYFIHLAFTDHCPNVVVDARGCGCRIICNSCAGTEEIAGPDSIVIEDMDWDRKTLIDYRNPPPLDFSKQRKGRFDHTIDIKVIAERYVRVIQKAIDGRS